MANITPPRQVQLVREDFPSDTWATSLTNMFNQFVVQTCSAFGSATTIYKNLTFTTGVVPADSFPIDIPVGSVPNEVRLAQVVFGASASANQVQWTPLASGQTVRISLVTGLLPSTSYVIKLAME